MRPIYIFVAIALLTPVKALAIGARGMISLPETEIVDRDRRVTIIRSIEELWRQGQQFDYFDLGSAFLKRFSEVATKEESLFPALTEALNQYCEKPSGTDLEIYQRAIVGKIEAVSAYGQLLRVKPNLAPSESVEKYIDWATSIVEEIEKKFDPKYVEQHVELTVPLPNRNVEGAAGMDPKFIKDPQARAEYQRAIDENLIRSQTNGLQQMLKLQKQALVRGLEATRKTLKDKALTTPDEKFEQFLKRAQ